MKKMRLNQSLNLKNKNNNNKTFVLWMKQRNMEANPKIQL